MLKEITPSAVYMGFLAAFVGYLASFAIVLAGLKAVGATDAQAATGLFYATIGTGLGSIILPWILRIPAAVAWSTPGAAFLAATTMLDGGFNEAVGAMIICAGLILLTGFVPAIGRFVTNIPKPVAGALLAGVLIKLCFAPVLALGEIPHLMFPVLLAWLVGLYWNRLFAMPLAMITFFVILGFVMDYDQLRQSPTVALFPNLSPFTPIFTLNSVISISIPLYLVTMAGQNIPGFAVLSLNGYEVDRQALLRKTGFASLLIAPFGSVPANMSAITAAMVTGADAGPNPNHRYWAAIFFGIFYASFAFLAAFVTTLASIAPAALITGVAGLALIPALVKAMGAAFEDEKHLEAPALTFLMTASGMTLFGISGAFWGVLIGATLWMIQSYRSED